MNITGYRSARGLSQAKFGQQNEDGASIDAWRHYDSRELFLRSPRCSPKGPVSPSESQFDETMWRHFLLMPPGKKTKNMLACVFTVANVLGTCHLYHCSLLIYRLLVAKFGYVIWIWPQNWQQNTSSDTFAVQGVYPTQPHLLLPVWK